MDSALDVNEFRKTHPPSPQCGQIDIPLTQPWLDRQVMISDTCSWIVTEVDVENPPGTAHYTSIAKLLESAADKMQESAAFMGKKMKEAVNKVCTALMDVADGKPMETTLHLLLDDPLDRSFVEEMSVEMKSYRERTEEENEKLDIAPSGTEWADDATTPIYSSPMGTGSLSFVAKSLMENKGKVLFVTGAGLSVASGISPYRASPDAIWATHVTELGTRRTFLKDPLRWYRDFWLPSHRTASFTQALPNPGHQAIQEMVEMLDANVITQNGDGLHRLDPERCISIHGQFDLFKCTNDKCPFSHKECLTAKQVGDVFDEDKEGNVVLKSEELPRCCACHSIVMPMALLFDEEYTSHNFFRFAQAKQWTKQARIVVFVGTSFSVGITEMILRKTKWKGVQVINFNVGLCDEGKRYHMHQVIGACEEMLPALVKEIKKYE